MNKPRVKNSYVVSEKAIDKVKLLLRNLLTEYTNSEQYTLELLMSEYAHLYMEIEDEELVKLGLLGVHYIDRASNISYFLVKSSYSLINRCVSFCVDASVFDLAYLVYKLEFLYNATYVIVSNINGLESIRLTRGYRGQLNGALQGVSIELTIYDMEVGCLDDISHQVTKVPTLESLNVKNIQNYLCNYPNLLHIKSKVHLFNLAVSILSVGSVRTFYNVTKTGCQLLFETVESHPKYSAEIFNAGIVLLYFGELTMRILGNHDVTLGQYSYNTVLEFYRCFHIRPVGTTIRECLDMPVTEEEDLIVRTAMKKMEIYISGCCGL